MDNTTKTNTIRRLQIIEGHVRAVHRMIEDDAGCVDIIRQIDAVQSALGKVSQALLVGHLQHCVAEAVRGDDVRTREKVLGEIAGLFEHVGAN